MSNFKKVILWTIVFCLFMFVLHTVGFATNHAQNLTTDINKKSIITTSILTAYNNAQNSLAYDLMQKGKFDKTLAHWTENTIGNISNLVWNYPSFTEYHIIDQNLNKVETENILYYCTFTADNDKYGYIVLTYGETAIGDGIINTTAVETPYLYDLQANSEILSSLLAKTDLDLSTTVATRISQMGDNNECSVEGIQFVDSNDRNYIYYFSDNSLLKVN